MTTTLYDPALRGFGDLAGALLLAPRIAERNRLSKEELERQRVQEDHDRARAMKLDEQKQQDRTLEQALRFGIVPDRMSPMAPTSEDQAIFQAARQGNESRDLERRSAESRIAETESQIEERRLRASLRGKAEEAGPVPTAAYNLARETAEQSLYETVTDDDGNPVYGMDGKPERRLRSGVDLPKAIQFGMRQQGIDPVTGRAITPDAAPTRVPDPTKPWENGVIRYPTPDLPSAPAPMAAPAPSALPPTGNAARLPRQTEYASLAPREMLGDIESGNVTPGTPEYATAVHSIGQWNPTARDRFLEGMIQRNPAAAEQLLMALAAAGVE